MHGLLTKKKEEKKIKFQLESTHLKKNSSIYSNKITWAVILKVSMNT